MNITLWFTTANTNCSKAVLNTLESSICEGKRVYSVEKAFKKCFKLHKCDVYHGTTRLDIQLVSGCSMFNVWQRLD